MTKVGTVFTFDAPTGWESIQEGSRYVFHGPNQEELIVSAALIQGIGASSGLAEAQQRLLQNAEQSARNAASHAALKVTQPYQRNASISKVECWTLLAQTSDGDTVFYQAVFRAPRGVLLATLEAPNNASAEKVFDRFINSVAVIDESEALVE
jgi:hypothetical protein